MKSLSNNETEVAIRLLTRIFLIDPRNATYFGLGSIAMAELRHNVLFMRHVKVATNAHLLFASVLGI